MFGPFWAISQKLKPCDPQLYMSFKHHAKILIKLIIQLQKKSSKADVRADGLALFNRDLSATTGDSKNIYFTSQSNWFERNTK